MGARGDEAALYRRHHERLVRVLQGALGVDRDLATDLAQFAWLKLLETQPERRPELFAWLVLVARREHYRRQKMSKRETLSESVPEAPDTEALELAELAERGRVAELVTGPAWTRLTDYQRTVLGLWAQGYSYRDIMAETGQTYTWVNRHLAAGIKALRQFFDVEPEGR